MIQKTIAIFVALFSLAILNLSAPCVLAQSDKAVEPTGQPQTIDRHVSGTDTTVSVGSNDATGNLNPAKRDTTVTIAEGETETNVRVSGGNLIVKGTAQDVEVNNGDIIVEPGGKLMGNVVCTNGRIRYVGASSPAARKARREDEIHAYSRAGWVMQQTGILVLGLLACGLMVMSAPNAAVKTSRLVTQEPGRCLLVGLIGGVGLLGLGLFNALLLHTPLRLLWSPFGFVIATLSMTALAFGWLCGMRRFGDLAALRLGKPASGGFAERVVLGLVCLFALTTFAGILSETLGKTALLFHWGLALTGLGGVILTRLRREEA